jgi:hypothetical protein
LHRDYFPGSIVPAPVLNAVESVYFNVKDYIVEQTKTKTENESLGGKVVNTLKELAPAKITNLFELIFALYLFFWIILITKLLRIRGQSVVDKPRFIAEESRLKELSL